MVITCDYQNTAMGRRAVGGTVLQCIACAIHMADADNKPIVQVRAL